jgi:hypothetical protein
MENHPTNNIKKTHNIGEVLEAMLSDLENNAALAHEAGVDLNATHDGGVAESNSIHRLRTALERAGMLVRNALVLIEMLESRHE